MVTHYCRIDDDRSNARRTREALVTVVCQAMAQRISKKVYKEWYEDVRRKVYEKVADADYSPDELPLDELLEEVFFEGWIGGALHMLAMQANGRLEVDYRAVASD